jgi:hypothetical protein
MKKFTEVADAPPVIVWDAVRTCFISKVAIELAPIETVVARDVPPKPIVKVCADPDVLETTMFVTTAVVADGTAYNCVVVVAVAAPLNICLVVVAINYYLS